jgi:phospholipid:diacylglycerol acyltransferase
MAPYDWRLSPFHLELRDSYFTRLKALIETSVQTNRGKKVVIVCHSMGGTFFHYFLSWVESAKGGQAPQGWVDAHVQSVAYIAVPWLGVSRPLPALLSGEFKDLTEISDVLAYLKRQVVSAFDLVLFFRALASVGSMIAKVDVNDVPHILFAACVWGELFALRACVCV